MNRSELIAAVADELVMNGTTKTTKKDAGVMVDTIVDIIAKTLVSGEKVSLSGFGTLDILERSERQGRNPKTGESMVIPASKTVKFKPAPSLKDAVNA